MRYATPSYIGEITRKVFCAGSALCLVFMCCPVVKAQDHQPVPVPSSDLAKENMSLVGASAAEIKAVVMKDAGLMVELKRWVAKDATDHGQVVGEADLTNDAIFERLERDAQFRSAATVLLQRYGYLLPQVNPESPLAKQQELLMQERVKWVTQEESEERSEQRSEREQELKDLQKSKACAQSAGTDCSQQQQATPLQMTGQPVGNGAMQWQPNELLISPTETPLPLSPMQPSPFGFPNQQSTSLQEAQLLRAAEQGGGDLSALGGGSSISGAAGVDGLTGESGGLGSLGLLSSSQELGGGTDGISLNSSSRGLSLGSNLGGLDPSLGLSALGGGAYGGDGY